MLPSNLFLLTAKRYRIPTKHSHCVAIVFKQLVSAQSKAHVLPWRCNLGFWERLQQIKQCKCIRKRLVSEHYGNQKKIIRIHFNKIKGVFPTIMDLQSNLALLIVNDYYPVTTPKPLIPNIIPVGGIQVRAPRELPLHIRRFLDEARAGAFYMHLGDEQLCAEIPKDKLDVLFYVFSSREERILWTCHDVQ